MFFQMQCAVCGPIGDAQHGEPEAVEALVENVATVKGHVPHVPANMAPGAFRTGCMGKVSVRIVPASEMGTIGKREPIPLFSGVHGTITLMPCDTCAGYRPSDVASVTGHLPCECTLVDRVVLAASEALKPRRECTTDERIGEMLHGCNCGADKYKAPEQHAITCPQRAASGVGEVGYAQGTLDVMHAAEVASWGGPESHAAALKRLGADVQGFPLKVEWNPQMQAMATALAGGPIDPTRVKRTVFADNDPNLAEKLRNLDSVRQVMVDEHDNNALIDKLQRLADSRKRAVEKLVEAQASLTPYIDIPKVKAAIEAMREAQSLLQKTTEHST